MLSLTSADAALKNYYLGAIIEQLNNEVSPFFSAIEKNSENIVGKDVNFVIAKGDLSGVIASAEGATMTYSRNNRYYKVTLPLKNMFGYIELTDKVLRASGSSGNTLTDLLNAEMEGLIGSAKANFARMLYGASNGFIGNVLGSKSSDTIYVDNAKPYLVGLNVKIYPNSGGTASTSKVISVNAAEKTVTFENNITCDLTSGGVMRAEAAGSGNELIGLAEIFDSDTLYGYSKVAEPYFKPVVKHVANDSLTEDALMDMLDMLEENADSKANIILCSHSTRRKIAGILQNSRRLVNTADFVGGFSSLCINDVPVYADKYCQDNRIYFLNTNDFMLCQLCDWSWIEQENGGILVQIAKRASYFASLVKYAELVCKKPCGQGLIVLD